ncbi:PfkB family carbohydrate kinase [Microvirga puerhi]|uniref:PfkB family carbohydrate kinase n=1 Tax=Microvirga puerhi TaxID=2876078 RepID=A0ABS7VV31_9HYPH|nr:PfkB family carbohydrate kinase [Microvirga puerhi]MBZ6078762.1 PfkB family carbohydrate kinase [Microvirga puerhi]
MADVVAFGELLVDFVPTINGLGLAGTEAFKKAAGGAPANVAVALARLGVPSAFMGMVGDDGFGHFLAETLQDAGVDVSPLLFTKRASTALAFVSLQASGEREFLFYRSPSADMLMAAENVDGGAIEKARAFHFGSMSLISDPSRTATLHAVDIARRAGKIVTYDPNLRLHIWPDADAAREGMLLGLKHAQIVKISEEEVTFLTGQEDPIAGARALWTDDVTFMAVTCGSAGCYWLTQNAQGKVPGFAVDAIDATGAGDAFMAGIIAGLLKEPVIPTEPARLDAICRFANAVGALTATGRGAIPSLPSRAAVETFLTEWPG